jgi:hypothetical protein
MKPVAHPNAPLFVVSIMHAVGARVAGSDLHVACVERRPSNVVADVSTVSQTGIVSFHALGGTAAASND